MSRKIDLEKKERILESARKLFLTKNYPNITIEEIARGSGIGKGTVYLYFQDKDDIFFELIRTNSDKMIEVVKEAINKSNDFNTVLNSVIENLLIFFKNNTGLFQIMRKSEFSLDSMRKKELKIKMLEHGEKMVKEVSKIFTQKNVPRLKMSHKILASYLLSVITSTINLMDYVSGKKKNISFDRKTVDKISDILLNGIAERS